MGYQKLLDLFMQQSLTMHSSLTMAGFYEKVIDDFGKKLFDKYSQKEQGFDSELIDQIKSRVRAKMENTKDLFNKALEIKHRSSAHQPLIKQSSQNSEVKKQQVDPQQGSAQEQAPDYANVFDVQQQEVKKQEADDIGVIKHEPHEDLDDEKDEQDERQKRQAVEKIKKNLHIHIVGTYERENKKHVARDESTKLCLENVFIKYEGRSEQIFVPKLQCEFKKE